MKNRIKVALANKLYKFVMKYTTCFEEPKIQVYKREHKIDTLGMAIEVDEGYPYSNWVRPEDVVRSKYSEMVAYKLAEQLLEGQYIDFKYEHSLGKTMFTGTAKVLRRD